VVVRRLTFDLDLAAWLKRFGDQTDGRLQDLAGMVERS
jgi:hypothetical protein